MLWALEAPATTSTSSTSSLHSESEQQPLQHMWDLLTTALGYNTPLDPHLAVAMLLSAAAVGSSNSGSNASAPAGLKQLSQVRGHMCNTLQFLLPLPAAVQHVAVIAAAASCCHSHAARTPTAVCLLLFLHTHHTPCTHPTLMATPSSLQNR